MLELLNEMLSREPFQPFRIRTTDCSQYDVLNPNLVALAQSLVVYCYPRSDRIAPLRFNQIVAVETLQAAA